MKNEVLILNLETATTVCSVALSQGSQVLAHRELNKGYTHAENLHVFIDEVLKEAGVQPRQLQAVAVSAGPGSYTGLRIGSSTAKGLAFSLGIPFIALNTLQVLAYAISEKHPLGSHLCPMLDAGRMEVYTAVYDAGLRLTTPVQAMILTEENTGIFKQFPRLVFGGEGMEKASSLLKTWFPEAEQMPDLRPSALYMPDLSLAAYNAREFSDIADFEPFYLKNFIAGKKKAGLS